MALKVNYEGIRADVIPALETNVNDMRTIHTDLKQTVETLVTEYMEGSASEAYANEFTGMIQGIFTNMETNLENYCKQLGDICSKFEAEDQQISSILNSGSVS